MLAQTKITSADRASKFLQDAMTSINGSVAMTVQTDVNGNQTLDLSASVGPYKVWTILMEEVADGTPTVAQELANTLGFTPTFARDTNGKYRILHTGGFPVGDTVLLVWPCRNLDADTAVVPEWDENLSTVDELFFNYRDTGDSPQDFSCVVPLELRIYDNPPNVSPPSTNEWVETSGNMSFASTNRSVGVTDPSHIITVDPALIPAGKLYLVADISGAVISDDTLIEVMGPFPGADRATIGTDYGSILFTSNGVDKLFLISQT